MNVSLLYVLATAFANRESSNVKPHTLWNECPLTQLEVIAIALSPIATGIEVVSLSSIVALHKIN